jgi:hypothetical protein
MVTSWWLKYTNVSMPAQWKKRYSSCFQLPFTNLTTKPTTLNATKTNSKIRGPGKLGSHIHWAAGWAAEESCQFPEGTTFVFCSP